MLLLKNKHTGQLQLLHSPASPPTQTNSLPCSECSINHGVTNYISVLSWWTDRQHLHLASLRDIYQASQIEFKNDKKKK